MGSPNRDRRREWSTRRFARSPLVYQSSKRRNTRGINSSRLFHTPCAGVLAAEPIGIWGEWIDDRAFCKVEVLSKHLLEKGPAMDGPVHNRCEGKLHLAHRDLITVASGLLARREWM